VRDQVILDEGEVGTGMRALKEEGLGCFGTVICVGSVLKNCGEFFVEEFEALPRVGGRDWGDDERQGVDGEDVNGQERRLSREAWRRDRVKAEKETRVLWTAARVRGLVLVKFIARDAEGARTWLGEMVRFEGTVAREFGEGGLMWLR